MINPARNCDLLVKAWWPIAAISVIVMLAGLTTSQADIPADRVSLRQEHPSQPFLRQDGLEYRNYALSFYDNYPNHTFPYVETPKVYYNDTGDFLMSGYDVWLWSERRGTGENYGSTLLADQGIFEVGFENVIVAKCASSREYPGAGFFYRLSCQISLAGQLAVGGRLDGGEPEYSWHWGRPQ